MKPKPFDGKFPLRPTVKEEITDLFTDLVYSDRDTDGKYIFHKGKALIFNYEGSPIKMRVTKIDRKKKRMWAEHIELHDQNIVHSHFRHNVDTTVDPPYCTDCEVYVTEAANEDGKKKYQDRVDSHLSDGTPI